MHAPTPVCPACAEPRRAEDRECPFCGVIYERFRARAPAPVVVAAPAASGPRGLPGSRHRLTLFTTLAEALEAGLTFQSYADGPAVRALPPGFARRLSELAHEGRPVSAALTELRALDAASAAMLAAAEQRGETPAALSALAAREEERREFRGRLLRVLLYPGLLLGASIFVMPLPQLFLRGLGAYLGEVLEPLVPLALLGGALFVVPRLDPDSMARRALRTFAARVPPLSQITWHRALASFADVLGASVGAGLAMRQALSLAASATGHPTFADQAERMVAALDGGATLTDAIEGSVRGLPSEYVAQLGHGEKVGKLDETLVRLVRQHRDRARALVTTAIVGAGLLATVVVAARMVASIVAGWTSYFSTINALFQ